MWRRLWILGFFALMTLALTGCDSSTFAKNQKGNELYSQGEFGEALESYQSAQIEQPALPEINYNLGNALHQTENYSEAITQTMKALNDSGTDLRNRTYYNVGNSYFRQGQYEEAIEAYKEALKLDPDDQDAKLNLELAQQRLQQQQENQSCENPQRQGQQNQQNPGQQEYPTPTRNSDGMTEEQARQLLEALAQEDETLQEHLLKLQPKSMPTSDKDW